MGVISQDLLDQTEEHQKSMERGADNRTVVQLKCCGASVEVTRLEEQVLICPNPECRKRHLLMWSLQPKIRSEVETEL